jgi:hypothetical protein
MIKTVPVRFQSANSRGIERKAPGSVGLRILLYESVGTGLSDGSIHRQGAAGQIKLGPSETAELSTPAPGSGRHENHAGELGMAFLEIRKDFAEIAERRRMNVSGSKRRSSGTNRR